MEIVTVSVNGTGKAYPRGISLYEISRDYLKDYNADIILASQDGNLRELNKKVYENCKVEFLTVSDRDGFRTYRRGMILLMLKAFDLVLGEQKDYTIYVEHSIWGALYCEMSPASLLNEQLLAEVKAKMRSLVAEDIPFTKKSMPTPEARAMFAQAGMSDKVKLLRVRRSSRTNVYSFDGYTDYYYGYMPQSAGILKYFDLRLYEKGFILQTPKRKKPGVIAPFEPQPKLFATLHKSNQWGRMMGIGTVADLNEQITQGNISDIMLIQEALLEKRIGEIAEQIVASGNKKFIMIAGPSSSGKTTFSHRLSIQLRTLGIKPHPIAVDDYFVNREDTPLDEDGKLNFESIDAIDIKQFNQDMTRLLNGERVEIPTFNFKLGKREYKGNYKQLGPDDVLVIEGIHCLNDKLSYTLPQESKFKIYISALSQLNIDNHNRISTTDGRLIRRMVRDARTRGTDPRSTIAMWPSVRRGEEENIFPYQESADVMFNSAMIYELPVLKQYAEPLLFGIPEDCPEYTEAKRLLKFLDYFLGVSSENVPKNSLLREFIGGSYFNV